MGAFTPSYHVFGPCFLAIPGGPISGNKVVLWAKHWYRGITAFQHFPIHGQKGPQKGSIPGDQYEPIERGGEDPSRP